MNGEWIDAERHLEDPLAPKASHVVLPIFLNRFLIFLLRFEAWMLGTINWPWGTSIVVLAQKLPMSKVRVSVRLPVAAEEVRPAREPVSS